MSSCEHGFERAEHQSERRPKLMTDVAEKGGLGPIDLGQRPCALPLFLVSSRTCDGIGDVAPDQVKKSPESRVKTFQRVGAGQHESEWGVLARHQNGKDHARPRGRTPRTWRQRT